MLPHIKRRQAVQVKELPDLEETGGEMSNAAVGMMFKRLAQENAELRKRVKTLERTNIDAWHQADKLREENKRLKRKADLSGVCV